MARVSPDQQISAAEALKVLESLQYTLGFENKLNRCMIQSVITITQHLATQKSLNTSAKNPQHLHKITTMPLEAKSVFKIGSNSIPHLKIEPSRNRQTLVDICKSRVKRSISRKLDHKQSTLTTLAALLRGISSGVADSTLMP